MPRTVHGQALAALLIGIVTSAVARAGGATVTLCLDPALGTAGPLASAVDAAIGPGSGLHVVAGEPIELAATRPAALPPPGLVVIVSAVRINDYTAARIVVVDAARGLRLDVDGTRIVQVEPGAATAAADVIAGSVRRAAEKAKEHIDRLVIAVPVVVPDPGSPPRRHSNDLPTPRMREVAFDDGIAAALLASRGTFLREVEYGGTWNAAPTTNAAPEFADTPTWTVVGTLTRQPDLPAGSLLPGTFEIALTGPDGTSRTASLPLTNPEWIGSRVIPATRGLARPAAVATAGPPRPLADRLTELAATRPGVAAGLLEFAVADAPADLALRRRLLDAYVQAIVTRDSAEQTYTIYDNARGEGSPMVVQLDRRLAMRRRMLEHLRVLANALVTLPPIAVSPPNPFWRAIDATADPQVFNRNSSPTVAAHLAAAAIMEGEIFMGLAESRVRAGRPDDGEFAIRAIDRLPLPEQAAATRRYLFDHQEAKGMIERIECFRRPNTYTIAGVGLSRTQAAIAFSNVRTPSRWRLAAHAAVQRERDFVNLVPRPPLGFRGIGFPGTRPTTRRAATQRIDALPNRSGAATAPTIGRANVRWELVEGLPLRHALPGPDGRDFAWRAGILGEVAGDGTLAPILDLRGPAGESGHVFTAAYDGRYVYAAAFRPWLPADAPTLWIYDTATRTSRWLEHELPPGDADQIAIAALAPGEAFVVGAARTTWYGTLTIDAATARFDRYGDTDGLPEGPTFDEVGQRPDPAAWLRPTTEPSAAADTDPRVGFVPTEAWAAGRDAHGRPTSVFVLRGTRRRPLIVSLVDRRVALFAERVTQDSLFRWGDDVYALRLTEFPTSRPATRPAEGQPIIRYASIVRLDPTTDGFVATCAEAVPQRGGPMWPKIVNGRLCVTGLGTLAVGDSPDRSLRSLLPFPGNPVMPAGMRVERTDAAGLTVWTGEAMIRGTYLPTATTLP